MHVMDNEIQIGDTIIDFEVEIKNTYNCSAILFPVHSLGTWINPKNSCDYTFGIFLKNRKGKIDQKFCWNYPENIFYKRGILNKITMQDMIVVAPYETKKIKIKANLSCINLRREKYEAHFELCQSMDNMNDILIYTSLGEAIQDHNAFFYSRLIKSNNFILEVK
jgi:hypothetical protein